MRKQQGLTLLEVLISLSILSAVTVGVVSLINNATEDTKAAVTAMHIKTVGSAASNYIRDNYAGLTSTATATAPALIRVSDLIAGGYLNAGYSVINPRRQTTCVLVLQTSANNLTSLVVTEGGDTIDDLTLGQIAANIGGDGGGIYSTAASTVRGAMGGWSLDLTAAPYSAFDNPNHLSQRCDGSGGSIALTAGHPSMALWFADGTPVSATLYRDAIPGNPSLNTMNTPILMGAGTVQVVGDVCSDNGALARDADGGVVSCVNNEWKLAGGSAYWSDPVANYAALPVCDAGSSNQTRVVESPSVGSGRRAYTCNGAGTWQPLSQDDSGSITIAGTATIDKLNGDLEITSVATEGSACSPNGRIARDSVGLLLSCQSGRWTSLGATATIKASGSISKHFSESNSTVSKTIGNYGFCYLTGITHAGRNDGSCDLYKSGSAWYIRADKYNDGTVGCRYSCI